MTARKSTVPKKEVLIMDISELYRTLVNVSTRTLRPPLDEKGICWCTNYKEGSGKHEAHCLRAKNALARVSYIFTKFQWNSEPKEAKGA